MPKETGTATAWPAVTTEPRSWVRTGDEVASRRQLRAASGHYQATVPPLIAKQPLALPQSVLAAADDASQELARFDAEVGVITAPFASILLRTESASSSEVENLTSGAREVALAELDAATSPNARLVVANVRAMQAALELADDISVESILRMQEALLGESNPDMVGQFRTEQVWIGGGPISPHNAHYIAPHHERVPELMLDLVAFADRTDMPVLAHAAIAHAQFETIHPFPDGNGRTGRALLHSMLRHGRLTRNVTVPVSAGLLHDTGRYFDALTAYRNGDPGAIVEAVSDAAFAAIANGRQLVADLGDVSDRWDTQLTTRRGSTGTGLKQLLLRQPAIRMNVVATELGVSTTAAQKAIDQFVEAGILTQTSKGRRNRVWEARDVHTALDQFGARARRQRP